jgi:uncharacterized OB-fold protein
MNNPEATLQDEYVAAFPENLPFWRAAAEGRFVVPRCTDCGKVHWHPRAHCPFCWSAAVEWQPATGRGKVYSYTIVRRADGPYVLAYVQIEEGPVMMTNVVECALDAVRIDMPVEVAFRATAQGRHAPVFRPTGDIQ